MSAKLWGGRFQSGLDPDAAKFSVSLDFDKVLYPYDIKLNIAHSRALQKVGVLSAEEYALLHEGLTQLRIDMDADLDGLLENDEDIHSAIERILTERLGDLGKKMHAGKSRNDQIITDVRMLLKDEIIEIRGAIRDLIRSLVTSAESHIEWLFPGLTHFQPGQPVLLSHHLMAYVDQLMRDDLRFEAVYQETDVCPLGSGAMAGNTYGLDRDMVAAELGFSRITTNSMDGVSDRDFMLSFCSAAAICSTHLSRLAEEMVLWSSPLVGFVKIGDAFTTGSSIMPQKKNPDIAELIRGKTGRVTGNLVNLLQLIKALPLTYNRDLQEDKPALFDTIDTVKTSLRCFAKMIPTLTFQRDAIDRALQTGYITATELADYLVRKGVPFREAHEITGKIVLHAETQGVQLTEIGLNELQNFHSDISEDIYKVLSVADSIEAKNGVGGTATIQVQSQIKRVQEIFGW
jgi:argininosuccinate lyase